MARTFALALTCLIAALVPGIARAAPDNAQGKVWLALSDSQLSQMRGGFRGRSGLMVSFGIVRSVTVNGHTTHFNFKMPDMGSVATLQAATPSRTAELGHVVQNGPGNTFSAMLPAGSPAIVIQNTLDNQSIQSVTRIDIVTNGMSLLKVANLLQTLNEALGAALTR